MPRGGTKCPDCGHRFKERRDLLPAESRIKGYSPNEQERAYWCPGNGSKRKHPPHIVKITRIAAGTPAELVKMKIITAGTAELMEEFLDSWRQANIAKYRPDLVFKKR